MIVFTVVLVAAEIPRVLCSLRLVDLDWLVGVGVYLHGASMVVLAGFVAFRVYGFFRRGPG